MIETENVMEILANIKRMSNITLTSSYRIAEVANIMSNKSLYPDAQKWETKWKATEKSTEKSITYKIIIIIKRQYAKCCIWLRCNVYSGKTFPSIRLVTDRLQVRYDATLFYSFVDFNNETLPTTIGKQQQHTFKTDKKRNSKLA